MQNGRPNPDGWIGGQEDFEFVRTLDGHLGMSILSPSDDVTNTDLRRNGKTFQSSLLGGVYDIDGESEAAEGELDTEV